MSVIAATVANYSGNAKKTLSPSDFLPRDSKRRTRRQSVEEMQQALRQFSTEIPHGDGKGKSRNHG